MNEDPKHKRHHNRSDNPYEGISPKVHRDILTIFRALRDHGEYEAPRTHTKPRPTEVNRDTYVPLKTLTPAMRADLVKFANLLDENGSVVAPTRAVSSAPVHPKTDLHHPFGSAGAPSERGKTDMGQIAQSWQHTGSYTPPPPLTATVRTDPPAVPTPKSLPPR